MSLQYTLDSFKQTLQHRHLLYCEQQPSTDEPLQPLPSSQQLIPVLEQFLIAYPQWQKCLSIANVVTSEHQQQYNASLSDACSLIEKTVPLYLEEKSNPSLIAMADICLLMLKPDDQQKWLKDVYHGSGGSNSVITLQRIDQLASTLNSILSNVGGEDDLKEIVPSSSQPLQVEQVFKAYQDAKKQRLFLFDYDGTLTPIVSRPEMALPTPALLDFLSTLCTDPLNAVWIISGRDQKFLHDCFGHLHGLGLSAEHGSFMKMPGEASLWTDMLKDAVLPWKAQAMAIFTSFTDGLPGTEIEQKKSSITWHYRNAHDLEAA
ncbi:trehalose-phosphatase-domain-containing protein [Absidia repens]|uniref:Trehalose 6-phosphate phosphatase n=1 Tax=Absidia repens TaxID=90262 RepID=A0A1X2HYM8_9FUNG|nr:trehalose-phosphatase-domain-containing protein [Absidia repens]